MNQVPRLSMPVSPRHRHTSPNHPYGTPIRRWQRSPCSRPQVCRSGFGLRDGTPAVLGGRTAPLFTAQLGAARPGATGQSVLDRGVAEAQHAGLEGFCAQELEGMLGSSVGKSRARPWPTAIRCTSRLNSSTRPSRSSQRADGGGALCCGPHIAVGAREPEWRSLLRRGTRAASGVLLSPWDGPDLLGARCPFVIDGLAARWRAWSVGWDG